MTALAEGDVRYVGDPIALVLAESRYLAEDACEGVWADVEPLPPVLGMDTASEDTENLVHSELGTNVAFEIPPVPNPELDEALASAGASRVETYLSKDQERLLVLFEGLDEAAAREVCGSLAITAVWDGYVIRSPESDEGGEVVSVVERDFPRPLSLDDINGLRTSKAWCLDLYSVTHKCSVVSNDGMGAFCVYSAPDHESVRSANRKARFPVTAMWRGTRSLG